MRKTGDIIASLFCILIGVAVMAGATRLRLGTPSEPQPGFFPFVSGAVLVVLCAVLLLQALSGRGQGAEAFGELWRPGMLMTGLLIYSVVLDDLGYILATMILSAVVLRVLDTKAWLKLAGISLVLSIGTYFLFDRLLNVSLPGGILSGFK